jgi:cytochrome P450
VAETGIKESAVLGNTLTPLDDRLRAVFESDPIAIADPYSVFDEVRGLGAAYALDDAILLTRYPDVRAMLQDNGGAYSRARFTEGRKLRAARKGLTPEQQIGFDEVSGFEALHVTRRDGEDHERLRRIAHRAFTPRRIAVLEASIQGYTDALLDPLAGEETVDLTEFAYTLPLMLISDMLGVPHADRELIHGWTAKIARHKGGTIQAGPLMEAHAAIGEFNAYVADMVDEHRRTSAGLSDLVAALIDAEQGEHLSTEELTGMFAVLIFGGHETTTNLIGIGVLELLRHREEWEKLCADPGLAAKATDELLRFVTPVQFQSRFVVQDNEIDGVPIRHGDTVVGLIAAANRDPAVFDNPGDLDIERGDSRRHLALGLGPHFCLGASLARMEGTVAFGTLARRFPGIELAGDTFEWRGSALLRGLAELPVHLGRDHGAARPVGR